MSLCSGEREEERERGGEREERERRRERGGEREEERDRRREYTPAA